MRSFSQQNKKSSSFAKYTSILLLVGLTGFIGYVANQPQSENQKEMAKLIKEGASQKEAFEIMKKKIDKERFEAKNAEAQSKQIVQEQTSGKQDETKTAENDKNQSQAGNLAPQNDDWKLVEIIGAESLEDGQMMELQVGEGKSDKVLISKYKGNIYAIGAFCSHFGAPLVNGVMFDDKVLCPWHAAGFSVVSGAIELAPGLDGVPKYKIHNQDGKYFVEVPKKLEQKQIAQMAKRDPNNKTKMVIVGGGAAGLNCAETLRQSNFTGEIIVLSNEKQLPYDRTILSKGVSSTDVSKLGLRTSEFLDNYDITYNLGYDVSSIDKQNKIINLKDGAQISYDKLLLATGVRARVPQSEGINLNNVFVLRSGQDQTKIKEAIKGAKNIVVIGGGFIGSECTANIKNTFKNQKNVSLICEGVPMERIFGFDVASSILSEHENNGAVVYTGKDVTKLKYKGDNNGNIKKVVLENGYEIAADLVIVGAGTIPNNELAVQAGLDIDVNGGIKVDPFLKTNDNNIFAAGDIASFPSWQTGQYQRIEHWITALDQGTHAAFNMLGKMVPYGNVPFFWTNHYGKGMQYIGCAQSWDEIFVDGSPRSNKFIAYFIKDNKVIAACSQGRNKELLTIFEAMQQAKLPPADHIKSREQTPESISKLLHLNRGGGACMRANCCQKKTIVL